MIILLCLPKPANANHVAGGEIYYVWVSDSTYRVYLKLYRDCTGDAEPSTMPLCLKNTCNNTGFSTTMTKYSSTGIPSSLFCPKYKTKCDSAASIYSGNIAWTYSALVKLPSRCSSWKIFSYANYRNPSTNLSNATSSGFYVEATLNNQAAQGNSSPYFSANPTFYVNINSPASCINTVTDPNNDSIACEIINSKTGVTSCADTAINATYASGYSVTYPFGPPYPASINLFNGNVFFTPSISGNFALAVRVKEYRNNILIGSAMREISVQPIPIVYATAPGSLFMDSLSGGYLNSPNIISGCVNKTIHFCMRINSPDSNTKMVLNYGNTYPWFPFPSAIINYKGQASDSVMASFTWTPSPSDTGNHTFFLTITDSTCLPLGPTIWANQMRIFIQPPMRIIQDTFVCPNGSTTLYSVGDVNYTWAILPGGTPNSLSCTHCYSTTVTPTVLTKYEATGDFCGLKDTVTIAVASKFIYPSVTITVSPDTIIPPISNAVFTAHVTNCNLPNYQWMLDGVNIPGATSANWNITGLLDLDKVSCKITCKDSCPVPTDTFSNTITMHIQDTSHPTNGIRMKVNSEAIKLYPNPNNGFFKIQLPDIIHEAELEIIYVMGRSVYHDRIRSNTTLIKLEDIPDGIYITRIKMDDGIKTKLFSLHR